MKRIHHVLYHKFHRLNKRQASFYTGVALIGVFFVAAIVVILTGRFNPLANPAQNEEQSGATGRRHLSRAVRLTGATLAYKDSAGTSKTEAAGNQPSVTVKIILDGTLSLQGLRDKLNDVPQLKGQLTVLRANGSPATAGDVVTSKLDWTSTSNVNASTRKLAFDNDTLRNNIDKSTARSFDFVLKPVYYLAVATKNVSNVEQLLAFPEAPAGDLNNDNIVNGGDFAVLVADYGKQGDQITDAIRHKDLNRSGTIGGDDFAILVSNYGRRGADF